MVCIRLFALVVKTSWPVGGALMQCFKAKVPALEVRAGGQEAGQRERMLLQTL